MLFPESHPPARVRLPWLGPVLLATALLLCLILDGAWLVLHRAPLPWDQGANLATTIQLGRALHEGDFARLGYLFFNHEYFAWRPPVMPLVGAVMAQIVGPSVPGIITLANGVWLSLLVIAMYRLGCRWWGRTGGMVAALVMLTAPAACATSRDYLDDLPLTAATAVAMWALVRCDGFRRRQAAALFGLAFGVAELIKEPAFVFILPAVLAVLVAGWRNGTDWRRQALANVSVSLAVAGGVTILGYGPQWTQMVTATRMNMGLEPGFFLNAVGITPWASFQKYGWAIAEFGLSAWQVAVPVFALLLSLLWRKRAALPGPGPTGAAVLAAWVIVPWLGFACFVVNHQTRYLFPVIPALVLGLTGLVMRVPPGACRTGVIALLLGGSGLQAYAQAFGLAAYPERVERAGYAVWVQNMERSLIQIGPPMPFDGPLPAVVRTLHRCRIPSDRPLLIGISTNEWFLNVCNLSAALELDNFPGAAKPVAQRPLDGTFAAVYAHYDVIIADPLFVRPGKGPLPWVPVARTRLPNGHQVAILARPALVTAFRAPHGGSAF